MRPPQTTSRRSRKIVQSNNSPQTTERLQRVISRLGIASRRGAEELIEGGRVHVDGHLASLGQKVLPGQRLEIDGRWIEQGLPAQQTRVLVYHKQVGEIVSRDDPKGRATVFDNLPKLNVGQWISVGRLDFNTSGLLIFTTSGDFANTLMHPRNGFVREYAVRIRGMLGEREFRSLLSGVNLSDGPARLESIEPGRGEGSNRWYVVTLSEGRNREVRRIFDALGYVVSRLIRTRFGPIELPRRLRPGKYVELSPQEINRLTRLENRGEEPDIGGRIRPSAARNR